MLHPRYGVLYGTRTQEKPEKKKAAAEEAGARTHQQIAVLCMTARAHG